MTLDGAASPRPLTPADVPLVVPIRDEGRFLPSLLAHYRRLGVTRFIVVDDRSTDGAADYLRGQPDVDLWTSNLRYGEADRATAWRSALTRIYGRGRWYVNIDADEYLIYPGSDRGVTLPVFIAGLEARGLDRLAAPMIDAYHPGPIAAARFTGDDGRMPWQVASHIDGAGYDLRRTDSALSLRGGPRHRVFGARLDLMKYPLCRWDWLTSYGSSIHRPLPFWRNYGPIGGILLHFKLFADLRLRSRGIVDNNQHYAGAQEYRRLLDRADLEAIDLACDHSIPIPASDDLVRLGFMAG